MIEIPAGKFFGQTNPYDKNMEKLGEFLFDPANKDLKKAFEKAAGVKLEQRGRGINFFADKRESVPVVTKALEEMAKEVKLAIDPKKFQDIVQKLG